MYRPKKPNVQPSGNIRLSKQPVTPAAADFDFLRTQALESKGRTVELPWVNEGETYMLTCKMGEGEPFWSFYSGDPPGSKLEWQYATPDLELIQSIIWQQVGGPDMIETFMSSASAAGKKKDGPANKETGFTSQQFSASSSALPTIKPSQAELKSSAKAIMQGDLSNMQVPTLLQSINMSKMTGRLQINNKVERAQIFFHDGVPMHAVAPDGQGDVAIVECLTWVEGDFQFFPNEKSPSQTINKRLDSLLMEGITLLDQSNYLKQSGLKPESLLVRTREGITQDEFIAALTKGAPLDLQKQSAFYLAVDNHRSFTDILRLQPMGKMEWMPIMFNMIQCGLVQVREKTKEHPTAVSGDAHPIDRDAIAGVVRALTRSETGLYTYPAFLYFAEQEFARCAAFNWTLSLIMFDLSLRAGDKIEQIPLHHVKEAVRRIDNVKRPFDVFAHFETFKYAMLLPNTNDRAAKVFVQRLLEVLNAEPLVSGTSAQVVGSFGIASAPDDTQDLGMLIGLARDTRRIAFEAGVGIMTLRESKSSG